MPSAAEGHTDRRPVPPCPECGAATEPITVEGDEAWRCAQDACRRRTYGLPEGEDDDNLPPFTENGIAYYGTGELDLEATDTLRQMSEDEDDDEEEPDLN